MTILAREGAAELLSRLALTQSDFLIHNYLFLVEALRVRGFDLERGVTICVTKFDKWEKVARKM